MDRNLALEFVRVTEAAAIASARWIGRGDKHHADKVAVDEMRARFNQIDFAGRIVIGEGKKDQAPELYTGEKVGRGKQPIMDIAVDPLEATDSVAYGRYNAISVIAAGPKHSLLSAPDTYMNKIAVGHASARVIDLDAPIKLNIQKVAKALGKDVREITVMVLDRERHQDLILQIRKIGARVRLITDGDVAGAIAPSLEDSDIDILMGIGASAEAVLAGVAIKILGGEILTRFEPRNKEDMKEIKNMGANPKKIYSTRDLAKGNHLSFTATGVITGPLVQGVVFAGNKIITHSVAMRSASKTIRYITTYHHQKNNK